MYIVAIAYVRNLSYFQIVHLTLACCVHRTGTWKYVVIPLDTSTCMPFCKFAPERYNWWSINFVYCLVSSSMCSLLPWLLFVLLVFRIVSSPKLKMGKGDELSLLRWLGVLYAHSLVAEIRKQMKFVCKTQLNRKNKVGLFTLSIFLAIDA